VIGNLGDPNYLQKTNALYYEFEEVGVNKQFGYSSPADLTDLYPRLYFDTISVHLQSAIRYLNVTTRGRQWINSLYSNVFRAETLTICSGHPLDSHTRHQMVPRRESGTPQGR
jgi:hypothetical protein